MLPVDKAGKKGKGGPRDVVRLFTYLRLNSLFVGYVASCLYYQMKLVIFSIVVVVVQFVVIVFFAPIVIVRAEAATAA